MTAIQLRRVDPARNMARFYVMAVQPTLFWEWESIRELGRIGSPGRIMTATFASLDEAAGAAMTALWREKMLGGYSTAPGLHLV